MAESEVERLRELCWRLLGMWEPLGEDYFEARGVLRREEWEELEKEILSETP